MSKRTLRLVILLCAMCSGDLLGQGLHFSQFYNAPMLVNAANTGLMPANDYRLGLNYRKQWGSVPVPYMTFSAFGDCKVGGNNSNREHNNWLGLGLAVFTDKAGDGSLAMTQVQGSAAYHLHLSETFMMSAGLSGLYAQRSVNYAALTFDAQWDGFTFNSNLPNAEAAGVMKTNYYSVGAGLNFAWFPNEGIYSKLGLGVTNINQPVESFYGGDNKLAYRPTANLEVMARMSDRIISVTSAYYTTQSAATDIVVGEMGRILLSDARQTPLELLVGGYWRVGDAIIGAMGVQVQRWQMVVNYDFTMSQLSPYNQSRGAFELSLIYQGLYHPGDGITKAFSCPRFF